MHCINIFSFDSSSLKNSSWFNSTVKDVQIRNNEGKALAKLNWNYFKIFTFKFKKDKLIIVC